MKWKIWGARGSLPAGVTADEVRRKVRKALEIWRGREIKDDRTLDSFIEHELPFSVRGTYGGNTTCVQIENDLQEFILFDAGTGIRDFAHWLDVTHPKLTGATFHIVVTHLHWDHVQGFPFFTPIYREGNRVVFHTYHEETERVFREQMTPPTFPVPFRLIEPRVEFVLREPAAPFSLAGFDFEAIAQRHPGVSYGYRVEKEGKAAVFSTDSEHKEEESARDDYPFLQFIRNVGLLIFDAQYTLADANYTKADWGHSSNVMGVELARRGRVKHLCLFHNEPTASDKALDEFLFKTRMFADIVHQEASEKELAQYPERISLAYDGMEIEI